MRKLLLAAVLSAAFVSPALANQCPTLIKKAEAALQTASLDDATKTKVTELIAKGKSEHDGGNHAQSEADLNEALKMLGAM
jgi:hypothetical protein